MNLEGRICRLRAVEPRDVDTMYAWENDPAVWNVSGTTAPFSRDLLERFVEQQRFDLWQTRQIRLMIEPLTACDGTQPAGHAPAHPAPVNTGRTGPDPTAIRPDGSTPLAADKRLRGEVRRACPSPVGALDLFELDPLHRRAGLGILIHDRQFRGKGYAADALEVVCRYARTVLGLHQLWCDIGADNAASLALFRRAGFSEAGLKRDWQWTSDGYRDEIMMQKILSD